MVTICYWLVQYFHILTDFGADDVLILINWFSMTDKFKTVDQKVGMIARRKRKKKSRCF